MPRTPTLPRFLEGLDPAARAAACRLLLEEAPDGLARSGAAVAAWRGAPPPGAAAYAVPRLPAPPPEA